MFYHRFANMHSPRISPRSMEEIRRFMPIERITECPAFQIDPRGDSSPSSVMRVDMAIAGAARGDRIAHTDYRGRSHGMEGGAASVSDVEHDTEYDIPEPMGHQYGQDTVMTLSGTHGTSRWHAMAVFDGHGFQGEMASMRAAASVSHYLRTESEWCADAVTNAREGATVRLRERFTAVFETIDASMPMEGGTTATLVLIVNKRLVVVHVGDSPALLVPMTPDPSPHMGWALTTDHNWDMPREYHAYLERCAQRGRRPYRAVRGRINCSGGQTIPDDEGRVEAYPIFLPDTDRVDLTVAQRFNSIIRRRYPVSVGGSQSVRRMVYQEYNATLERWEDSFPLPGFESTNWGATLAVPAAPTSSPHIFRGSNQLTRSLGDAAEKASTLMRVDPDVAVFDLNPSLSSPVVILISSDGISDRWYGHELVDLIVPQQPNTSAWTATDMAEEITNHTWGASAQEALSSPPGFPLHPTSRRPAWDDCSVAIMRISWSVGMSEEEETSSE